MGICRDCRLWKIWERTSFSEGATVTTVMKLLSSLQRRLSTTGLDDITGLDDGVGCCIGQTESIRFIQSAIVKKCRTGSTVHA